MTARVQPSLNEWLLGAPHALEQKCKDCFLRQIIDLLGEFLDQLCHSQEAVRSLGSSSSLLQVGMTLAHRCEPAKMINPTSNPISPVRSGTLSEQGIY